MKPRRGKTILFAEDDIALQKTVKVYLEREGYDVKSVNDGSSCVTAVQTDRPSLLLLDIAMPKLDGIGVLEVLSRTKTLEELPVVLFTASANKELVMKAAKLGVADYLVKPFALRDLGLRVHRQLDDLTADEALEVRAGAQEPKDSTQHYATIPEAREGGWKTLAASHGGLEACVLVRGADSKIYLRRGTAGWRAVWASPGIEKRH